MHKLALSNSFWQTGKRKMSIFSKYPALILLNYCLFIRLAGNILRETY